MALGAENLTQRREGRKETENISAIIVRVSTPVIPAKAGIQRGADAVGTLARPIYRRALKPRALVAHVDERLVG